LKALALNALKDAAKAGAQVAMKQIAAAVKLGKPPDMKKLAASAMKAAQAHLKKAAAKLLGSKPKLAALLKKTLGPKAKLKPIAKKVVAAALKKIPGIKGLQKPTKPPLIGKKPKPPAVKAPVAKPPGAKAGAPPAKKPAPPGAAEGGGGKGDHKVGLHTPKYKIKAGKAPKPLPAAASSRLVEIVIDQAVDMADMAKIVFRNDDFAIGDHEDFKPGSKLEIELGYEENGSKLTKVFTGEVTALQADFPRRGPMTVRLVAYTEYHRLMKGRHIRAFENMTYADVAKAVGGECGLKVMADNAPGKHEFIFQRNQTNLEFLLELAEKVGFEVFAGDGTLFFRKASHDKAKIRKLKKGEQLLSFNPKTSVALMPTSVKVISWNDNDVAQVTGEAKVSDSGPKMGGKEKGVEISEKIGAAQQVFTERVFRVPDAAKALAISTMRKAALDYVQAEATCQGAGDLRPGFVVEIDGVGPIFSGPYYIVRVVHDFLPSGFVTRLGLKKTSIVVPPPGEQEQEGAGQDYLGDLDIGGGEDELDENGNPKKPKLKNVKLAVGDKPPPWWYDKDSDLDNPEQIRNLKLKYGPKPPPIPLPVIEPDVMPPPALKLSIGKNKVRTKEQIDLMVEADLIPKVDLKVEPKDIASLSKASLDKSDVVIVTGQKDGKCTIVATGTGQGKKFEEKVDLVVEGHQVRFMRSKFEQPVLKMSSDLASVHADKQIPIKVVARLYDQVDLKVEPAGLAKLDKAAVRNDDTVNLLGIKDGKVTITASGKLGGAEKAKETIDIQVIGHQVRWREGGSGFKNMIFDLQTGEDQADTDIPLQITVISKGLDVVNLKVEPAGIGVLSQSQVHETALIQFVGKRDGKATITGTALEEGIVRGTKKLEIAVIGPQVFFGKAAYEQSEEFLKKKKELEMLAQQEARNEEERAKAQGGKGPGQQGPGQHGQGPGQVAK
jgi:phage protein D/cellobiose-specific phosphotransferase system component IIB